MVKEMLFRPSFCANCGEKIDRADWGLLTSRRFCQVCESEFKGQDLIPRFIVAAGILAGIFGFGSYLKSGSVSEARLVKQPRKFVDQPVTSIPPAPIEKQVNAQNNTASSVPSVSTISNSVSTLKADARIQEQQRPAKFQSEPAEAAYTCGASTLKGTACRRRVKANVRCFQHIGMPSLLPPDQLRIR